MACLDDSGVATTVGNTTPVPVGVVPDSVCPNIPRPVGGGSCSGTASSGSAGMPTCSSTCNDTAGDVWEAVCGGTTCTCTYNGVDMCTCTMTGTTGSCVSCCPGAG